MTREDAKYILLARRPWARDDQDPEVAEALALAGHDSELGAWLEKQTVFQESVWNHLLACAAPPDLRERILARRSVIVPLWRRLEVLLLAACLVLATVLAVLWTPRMPQRAQPGADEPSVANFQSRMVGFAIRLYRMDIVTQDFNDVRHYLSQHGAPADINLTPGLQPMPVKGGAKLLWHGNPVSMVCFHFSTNDTLYMFVMDERAIQKGDPPGTTPFIEEVGGISTAIWRNAGKVYLVAAPADPGVLKQLVAGGPSPAAQALKHPELENCGSVIVRLISARPPHNPVEILALARVQGEGQSRRVGPGGRRGTGNAPAVDLRMAIGKSKAGSAIVIGSGQVCPHRFSPSIEEIAVVNAVRMLFNEDENPGC